jgi:flavin reductase (DIM6/NTAB) family NADH-FMN oxidoreductase RutF
VTSTSVPPGADTIDATLFRQLLRRHANTVVVVTVAAARPAGFTATSFTSVSVDPPLVSFAISHESSILSAMAAAETVAIHLLSEGQEGTARTFATSGIDRFADRRDWRHGPGGVPILDGVVARLVCRIVRQIPVGDHTIVLAAPNAGEANVDKTVMPLVYHDGRYAGLRALDPSAASFPHHPLADPSRSRK